MSEGWTVLKLLRWTADYFAGRDLDSPRLDAELLLADTLGLDRVGLYLNFERPLQADELAVYREKVRRRASREPLAYILGRTEFWSLPFMVTPAVLIPRPDTELLVEEALPRLADAALVLDVGTGSGALAIALAHERQECRVVAIDVSVAALTVAAENARKNGVAERIEFRQIDLAALPAGPFDLVVANPPYIPSGELTTLMPDVRDFEPQLALDGGVDGLAAYRALAGQAGGVLAPGAWLLVEVGIGQAPAVEGMFISAGLTEIFVSRDLAGIERVVGGRKPWGRNSLRPGRDKSRPYIA
ncbi:MAG: peptide chain release factor N(5)-glutamine methyltransferase [Desulfuromonadales bacterium]|nr:peptide chain release factor N(5)-glutamine methyltransferase [Desulfuromonadales bacterium]